MLAVQVERQDQQEQEHQGAKEQPDGPAPPLEALLGLGQPPLLLVERLVGRAPLRLDRLGPLRPGPLRLLGLLDLVPPPSSIRSAMPPPLGTESLTSRSYPGRVAQMQVQGNGLVTSRTSATWETKRTKPPLDQWLRWPGVLPRSRT